MIAYSIKHFVAVGHLSKVFPSDLWPHAMSICPPEAYDYESFFQPYANSGDMIDV